MRKNTSVVGSIFWSFGGNLLSLGLGFGTNVILASYLLPKQFGQLAILMFFVVIAQVISSGGLGGALVREKEVNSKDFSTVLSFSLIIGLVCYLLLFFSAPFVSRFYDDESLSFYLRLIGLVILLNSFHVVNYTKLVRELKFKTLSILQIISMITAAITAILMANMGYGTLSLIVMQLVMSITMLLSLWLVKGVFIDLRFYKKSFKTLYSFGVNTTLTSIISKAFDEVYSLILAKLFSKTQVGFYYQGKKLQSIPINVFNSLAQGVVFSYLSNFQEDTKSFQVKYNLITILFSYLIGALIIFIFINSYHLIDFIYGVEWIETVLYLKILIFASYFIVQDYFLRVIFKVFNQTDKILKMEMIKKGVQALIIVIGILSNSIIVILLGLVLSSIFSFIISCYFVKRLKVPLVGIDLKNVSFIFIFIVLIIGCYNYFVDSLGLNFFKTFSISILALCIYSGLLYLMKIIDFRSYYVELNSLIKRRNNL